MLRPITEKGHVIKWHILKYYLMKIIKNKNKSKINHCNSYNEIKHHIIIIRNIKYLF